MLIYIYRSFHDLICKRLAESGTDPSLLTHLKSVTQATYPVPISRCVRSSRQVDSFWCVIPLHPVWFKSVSAAARRLSLRLKVKRFPSVGTNIGIAWSLNSPVLSNVVAKF